MEAPATIVLELAVIAQTAFSLTEGFVNRLQRPAKRGGAPIGIASARRKLKVPDYSSGISGKRAVEVCKKLDKGLMTWFGYSGCEDRHNDRRYTST